MRASEQPDFVALPADPDDLTPELAAQVFKWSPVDLSLVIAATTDKEDRDESAA